MRPDDDIEDLVRAGAPPPPPAGLRDRVLALPVRPARSHRLRALALAALLAIAADLAVAAWVRQACRPASPARRPDPIALALSIAAWRAVPDADGGR